MMNKLIIRPGQVSCKLDITDVNSSKIVRLTDHTVHVLYAARYFFTHLEHIYAKMHNINKQELSYRKQIARQLHTQYVEGIHRPKYYTVTLKSRLRVTQGHRKRNHWIDHTRFSSSRVI